MKQKQIKYRLFCFFLIMGVLFFVSGVLKLYSDSSFKSISVLNSYHEGFVWINHKTVDIFNATKDYYMTQTLSLFYETYKRIIIAVEVIILLLLSFIIALILYIKKISKMKAEILRNHKKLTQLYNELTDADARLKQQLEELKKTQKSLIRSEERYSLLFEKMLNGFFVFEPIMNEEGKLIDIRFLDINPGFKNQTHINTDKMIGKTWIEVFGYPNRDLHIYHNILYTGESGHFETYYAYGDIYYLVNAFKIADNQIGVVFDNITEYKQAIKQITMLNEHLEQRVIDRTDDIQNVVNELEAFAHTVSHDLKSPIRAIDGYTRILIEDYGEELGEDGNEILKNIRNICKEMIEMINKLLKYSTTSKADIIKEQVDIEEIFKSIFSELELVHQDRDIRLIIETRLPTVFADRVMLRQVIYNILSNAVKFTKYREKAFITVGCTITVEEYIFYVKDNGAGFDMDFSGKLFGIFERLHTSDEFEGSGIGLVTIKKIIQKHGGRVWIEGEPEVGAVVYFTLPVAKGKNI